LCINFVENLLSVASAPVSKWCSWTGINGAADRLLNHTATNDCYIPNRSEEVVFNCISWREFDILSMGIVSQVAIV
jgi:hypothetical protein